MTAWRSRTCLREEQTEESCLGNNAGLDARLGFGRSTRLPEERARRILEVEPRAFDQDYCLRCRAKSGSGINRVSLGAFPLICPAPWAVRRDDPEKKSSLRTQYAAAFIQSLLGVGNETKRQRQEHPVERAVREGEVFSVPPICLDAAPGRDFEHSWRWIDPFSNVQRGSKAAGADTHLQPSTTPISARQAKTSQIGIEYGLPFRRVVPAVVAFRDGIECLRQSNLPVGGCLVQTVTSLSESRTIS